ncbi:radical SAM protein, partial [bacterium]|nr:radical SAM protein [bacterium]
MAPKKDYSFLELNQGTDWSKDNKNRVLFCAINVSGYYSLAIRLLCLLVADISELRSKFSFRYVEWTDIDELDEWYSQIEQWQPDLLCVSINVWSRDLLFRFAANLKKRLPGMTILAGGQELTYSAEDYLIQNPALDYIIDGEGELAIQEFLNAWNVTTGRIKDHNNVSGLHYRQDGKSVNSGPVNYINNLNENPSPILAGLVPVEDKDKLGVLIEATRGCPFHCSYCFEGARNNTIRTVSLHRIKQEVEVMASKGARYFHMLDPILCNSRVDRLKYLYEMFSVLQRKYGYLDISVEAYADQISEEVAGYLDMCSIVDIGLQSTNPKTVQEIHRSFNEDKFCQGITWLQQTRANINIYLILGLPYETIHSFFNGLLFVIRCNPTQIFVNELCVLNGTELRHRAAEYQYSFNTTPPYLAQSNAWLSSTQMLLLRQLANTMKNRYNMNCYLKLNNLPWFKHGNIDFGDSLHLLFNSSTSCECIDSTFIDCSKFKGSNALDSLLDVVQGKNVKLTITNNVDIPALKKIASMV